MNDLFARVERNSREDNIIVSTEQTAEAIIFRHSRKTPAFAYAKRIKKERMLKE